MALAGHKCSSSPWVCIDHFTSDDYTVSKDGLRIKLKPMAVPSLFDVIMIEVNEDYDQTPGFENIEAIQTNSEVEDTSELKLLKLENEKLILEIEELKRKQQSDKLIADARIEYVKNIKVKQWKEIESLKKQLDCLKYALAQAQEAMPFKNLEVILFISNIFSLKLTFPFSIP